MVGEAVLVEVFVSVVDSIAVGIGICRVGSKSDFLGIGQSVHIRVGKGGVGLVEFDFVRIDQAIPVGVRQVRIGLVGEDFLAVT